MLINIILIATIFEIIIFAFLILIINKWISQVKALTVKVFLTERKLVHILKKVRLKTVSFNRELERKFTIKNSDIDFLFKMFVGLVSNILIPQMLPSGGVFRAFSLISGDLWKNKNKLFLALAAFILRPNFAMKKR